jgi:hypothetical protein
MRRTAPLFRPDAGWLFVAAGLAVCAAVVILPAQGDFKTLQQQLDTLRTEESRAYARLKAYNDFLDELDEEDPALVRRLAASQLNIVPASDRPVLLSTAQIAPVTNWIEATVSYDSPAVRPLPDSTLSKLANGPLRLWLFAGGIMCVFMGLLMGSPSPRRPAADTAMDLDDARLDRGELRVEAPKLVPAETEAAAMNEVATESAAESHTTIGIDTDVVDPTDHAEVDGDPAEHDADDEECDEVMELESVEEDEDAFEGTEDDKSEEIRPA